jgi:hypothetical protein
MTDEETPENADYALLRDYILFPQLTAAVQRGLGALEGKPNVLNRLYNASGAIILQKITVDLRENRLAVNRAGLRITRTAELNGMLHVEYKRGNGELAQTETYAVAREFIRKEMGAKMAQYIVEFGALVGHK